MKEYYKTELGKLYKGDCLEVMDALIKEGVKEKVKTIEKKSPHE